MVREAAARAKCQNNLKQLGLAVHNYEGDNKRLPPYFGTAPGGNSYPWVNPSLPYGGWFVHLLPYVEQDNLWKKVAADCLASGQNQPWYDVNPSYTAGGVVVQQYNGHSYIYQSSTASGGAGYHVDGIWIDGVHQATYTIMRCPSDPTATPDNLVYGYWGGTSYLANYNAWAPAVGNYGLWAPPVDWPNFQDGTSNTVLFGEGYQNCDGIGRIALYSWFYHNFGLDWYQNANTLMFQDKPLPADCDNWRAQSAHRGGMNVCLADGSVRRVNAGVSQATWTNALLPADGNVLGSDW
jgi:prepilin-type processing-associated H-X9-DG protein